MTDVFAICLFLYVYSAQVDQVVRTGIPDGVAQWPSILGIDVEEEQGKEKDMQLCLLNGSYLFVGAGVAMFFLRWFWQMGMRIVGEGEDTERSKYYGGFDCVAPQRTSKRSSGHYAGLPEVSAEQNSQDPMTVRRSTVFEMDDGTKRTPTRTRWKVPATIIVWIVICFSMSFMPYPLIAFREEKLNKLFHKYLPKMNHMARKKLPASLGSCDSSTNVPTPCKEQGKLYNTVDDSKRIAIDWITGLNTLTITELHVREHKAASDERRQLKDTRSELRDMTRGALIKKAVSVGVHEDALAKAAVGTKKDLIKVILRAERQSNADEDDDEVLRMGAEETEGAEESKGAEESRGEEESTGPEETRGAKSNGAKETKGAQETKRAEEARGVENDNGAEETRRDNKRKIEETTKGISVSNTSSTQMMTSTTWTSTLTTRAPTTSSPRRPSHPRYSFIVAGEFKVFRLYLKVDMCDSCPTPDSPELCSGCETLVASNHTCCEPHRKFRIEVSLHCDDEGVPDVRVHEFHLDSLVVSASADLVDDSQKQLVVRLPEKDITGQVRDTVKSKLNAYLTTEKIVKWGSDDLSFGQLLQRVLRFSRQDHLFQC